MIIFIQYAHLQTVTLKPVKFQRNLHKPVGGIAYTRHLLLKVDGRMDGMKNMMSLAFLRKGGRQLDNCSHIVGEPR